MGIEYQDSGNIINDHKAKAVIQCIKLLGLKNPEKIVEEKQGLYSHTNLRGRKRFFIPFLHLKDCLTYMEENPETNYKKCLGFYVVQLSSDAGNS